MSILRPFKTGDRVCFIGDSITTATFWISHIADYYAHFTDQKPLIYGCGVSGGSLRTANMYYDEETAIWNPNVAVIMLGMNDIARDYYDPETGDLKRAQEILENYRTRLEKFDEMLWSNPRIDRVIYLAPTPYDELQESSCKNLVGCFNALRKCAEIMREIAAKNGGEFYDFGGEFFELLRESYAKKSEYAMINPDRVHPSKFGHSVMARLFLAAQGFSEMAPTQNSVCDGTAQLHFSDKGKKYYDCMRAFQKRWSAERIVSNAPDQSTEGKIKYSKEYFAKAVNIFLRDLAGDYEYLVTNFEKIKTEASMAVCELFEEV